ncbi:response regulator transcription factor [Chelatococcus asaccharovorans]|uniref:Response regulator receiver domain-containing protein n=1 Tax=Chelatococcus asaccharovorans TaxID=28210 RepID=A0A2V3UHS9_9HYPH|nr:response regulator [Chelatococcus asaccharovorans]MBS7706624.1 response regulator [Chelatococcus asaccharovorans]PXW64726.1 response regulator receiver domain-containing protein [Chelatococcus asaccharovorans]
MQHRLTVAIVDDDDGVRASLSSLIRSLGYEARSYGSAPAFLADVERGDPDCMIADIQMPEMTGDELQAALLSAGRRFPMIFMTAFPTAPVRERVMAAGACAFLDKPAEPDTIAHHLASALGHGRA